MAADVRMAAGRRLNGILVALAAALLCRGAQASNNHKYLIASSPASGKVAYVKLASDGAPAHGKEAMRTLIDSDLKYPQGIAVDSYRGKLFVADPSLNKLVSYTLHRTNDALTVSPMQTVAENVEVRAVAVDGLGNVFFTDEPAQQILKVTAEMMDKGTTTPEVVYSALTTDSVSAPGGVAVDNFFVYWVNKASGTTAGSIARGLQYPTSPLASSVKNLAANAAKCYGLCIALGNIFYTDEAMSLYGVPRAAAKNDTAVTVSKDFQEPRGCTYDGDGTVYVADKTSNAVYQFAGNMMADLRNVSKLTKAADLQGAFGVAMYQPVESS
jgi:sugar lactone lactonase YvrE